ncbi:MAG: Ig-like domain-containing protein [Prevotellaceae bacterium]|nr:Ig-like domain-containing protein [Prevotellaceae bacterium]
MSNTANQITPVVFGETVTYENGMIYAINGGFAATETIVNSGSTNCDAGDDITFPTTTTVKSVFVHRRINNTSAQNTPLAVYENFAARLNNSTNATYSEAWGAGQNVFIGQVILTISEIGPATPIIGVDDETINFGTIAANATETVTTGVFGEILTGDLTVDITGTGAAAFTPSKQTITVAEAEAGAELGVTFNAAKDLAVGDYAATITISGGGAESVQIAVSGSIKEADLTAPILSTIAPLETAKLPLSGQIVLTFDEPVKFSGAAPQFEGVDGGISDENQNQVIFAYGDLTHSSPYTLTIAAGAITDLAGNSFAGGTWNWTSETPAPEIILQSPNQNVSVKAGVEFTILFDILNATSAGVDESTLPAGVTASYNNGSLVISGTAEALASYPGVFNYTVNTTAMAGYDGEPVTLEGTITVKDPNGKNVLYLIQAGNAGYSATEQANDKLLQMIDTNYEITVRDRKAEGASSSDDYSAYDLVVLHESINGADGGVAGNEAHEILGVDIPILNTKAYFYTNGRWGWGTPNNPGTTPVAKVLVPEHPIFAGITLDVDNQFNMFNTATDKNMQYSTINNIGGTILAVPSGQADTNAAMHEVTAAQRGVATAGYLMISLLATNGDDLTGDALLLYKNACDYLMGISDVTPPANPLESFTIKWSEATIAAPTATEPGAITFPDGINTDHTDCVETYFTLAPEFATCTVWLNGTQLVYEQIGEYGEAAWVCYGENIEDFIGTLEVKAGPPAGARAVIQRAGEPEGTVIATYSMDLTQTPVTTGINNPDANGAEVQDCFTVTGVKVPCDTQGIIIKRLTNGKALKEFNK